MGHEPRRGFADGWNRVRGAHCGPGVAGLRVVTLRIGGRLEDQLGGFVAVDHDAVVVVIAPVRLRVNGVVFVHRVHLVEDMKGLPSTQVVHL